MKTNRIKTIAKIKDVQFRNRSVYGNPSYFITFENEKGEEITDIQHLIHHVRMVVKIPT